MWRVYYYLMGIVLILFERTESDSPSSEGVYIGNTTQVDQWVRPYIGYFRKDATFTDTFIINLDAMDNILFKNTSGEYKFRIDSSDYYFEWLGIRYNMEFEIKSHDSLLVRYYFYEGFSGKFNQTNPIFVGFKQ